MVTLYEQLPLANMKKQLNYNDTVSDNLEKLPDSHNKSFHKNMIISLFMRTDWPRSPLALLQFIKPYIFGWNKHT